MQRDSQEYSQVFPIFKAFAATKYKIGYIKLEKGGGGGGAICKELKETWKGTLWNI